jgi:hypothetical protein
MPAGKTYENIGQTISLTGTTTSVVFSNISQNYTDLILVGQVVASTSGGVPAFRVNSLSSTNSYGWRWVGNTTGGSTGNNKESGYISDTYGVCQWYTTPSTSTSGCMFIAHFGNYTNTSNKKTWYSRGSSMDTSSDYEGTEMLGGIIHTTDAITSIELQMQFGAQTFFNGTTFTLYGVKAA